MCEVKDSVSSRQSTENQSNSAHSISPGSYISPSATDGFFLCIIIHLTSPQPITNTSEQITALHPNTVHFYLLQLYCTAVETTIKVAHSVYSRLLNYYQYASKTLILSSWMPTIWYDTDTILSMQFLCAGKVKVKLIILQEQLHASSCARFVKECLYSGHTP